MPNTLFIGDTHFNHRNILRYCYRPFDSIEEHDEILIDNWNSVVNPRDTIYHLGDFGFGSAAYLESILSRLNGNKFLIWGNHDQTIQKDKRLQRYFGWCKDLTTISVSDPYHPDGLQRIVLCHYAMRVWRNSHYGHYHLYGHSHNTLPDDPTLLSFDAGVDSTAAYLAGKQEDYRPITFEEIKERLWKTKKWEAQDHHA